MSGALTAGDVCTRNVAIAAPEMTVTEAARLMRERHVGCLVVVRETGAGRMPVGMLTDRDIVTAIVAQDVDVHALRVEDVMSTGMVTAIEDDSVLDLLGVMQRRGVRRVPVVGTRGELLGLVAMDDLLGVAAAQMQSIAAVIGKEHKRERARRG